MDPIWQTLPEDLAVHVCNQLPKVRGIPQNLKRDIESQRWMLAKSFNWYLRLNQFHARAAYSMFQRELGCNDVNEHWAQMTPEERSEFYYHPGGPGSPEGAWAAENELLFREWLNNT